MLDMTPIILEALEEACGREGERHNINHCNSCAQACRSCAEEFRRKVASMLAQ